ncbi:MAG: diacylglycerol kinase family protein [Lysinibacillus sp.]|nr:diacylglycerol kinase family protein [Lysinibacillus sp.]
MIRKFLRSFRFAFSGIKMGMKERNMRIHIICGIIAILAGFLSHLSAVEWLILILTIALVIGMEMVNTAIENVVDLVSPEYHPLAKIAKDVAAGAVLVVAIASVLIGLILFVPKWF